MCVSFMSGSREISELTLQEAESGRGRPGPKTRRERFREVGQVHSTEEAVEQRPFNPGIPGPGAGGDGGGKGPDQGESGWSRQALYSVTGALVFRSQSDTRGGLTPLR